MSQVKLTLRPPPNVDFVHGYPGIPPAGDRPQAAVKGAIEVRVGQQGVKAKWVRIELRKVETLPGGTPNTFTDYVGPSPVNLWQASEEYAVLHTQDFPFFIRIPESIPPSIALENRAGIKYELIAAVCTKGKKGFLQRRKSTVVSTTSSIIIDKHELHSTWPVYCQPERRHLAQEGVNLIVERNRTCYGPGDRVAVTATLRSDSLHTVILRGFELMLKETTIFRMGPFATAKKGAPLVKHNIIGENKFPVNATLYGGTEHRADLSCEISQRHTTTTINAARHIDITYVLSVKALMGTGTHLIMDLPVIVSNWPRNVSVEAIRRIGPAMSLSLLPANSSSDPQRQNPPPAAQPPVKTDSNVSYPYPPNRPNTSNTTQTYTAARPSAASLYPAMSVSGASVPVTTNTTKASEFGYARPSTKINTTVDHPGYGSKPSLPAVSKPTILETKATAPLEDALPKIVPRAARPAANPAHRLTVTNNPDDSDNASTLKTSQGPKHAQTASGGGSSRTLWPTAEEEKKRLYERARADVERVQGSLGRGNSANQSVPQSPPLQTVSTPKSVAQADVKPPPRTARSTPWPTAEEEKLRLFNEAQALARKTQALGSVPGTLHARSGSDASRSASNSKPDVSSTISPFPYTSPSKDAGGSGSTDKKTNVALSQQHSTKPGRAAQQYLTAEEEKAQLRRYQEAKSAVDRTQGVFPGSEGQSSQEPISYDALYPSSSGSTSRAPAATSNDLPPPFDASVEKQSILPEKERLRRAFDAQDAVSAVLARHASASAGAGSTSKASYDYRKVSPPPPFPNGGPSQVDAVSAFIGNSRLPGSTRPPPPHLRNGSYQGVSRPPPAAPVASGSRVLSAAEEKALLKAKYEAEDRAAMAPPPPNGTPVPSVTSKPSITAAVTLSTPPPLAPRPPAEYIQETREEDARVSRYVQQGITPPLDLPPANGAYKAFTPRAATFDGPNPGPPPPLKQATT